MPVLNRRAHDAQTRFAHVPTSAEASINNASGLAPGLVDPSLPRPVRRATAVLSRLFDTCANPECASGWLHFWRSRTSPIFERGWTCSSDCTSLRIQQAVRRELDGRGANDAVHRHRVPLGLVMLEQGWISGSQLREALDAQKLAGAGRMGQWLVRQNGVSEQQVARGLGLQWSCPVMALEHHDAEALAGLVPRLFLDAYGALPLRVAAGKLLYLGFEDRPDPVLALAVERMTGLRVETGLVRESAFRPAHRRMLDAGFPEAELIDAASEPAAAEAFAEAIEGARPVDSRLVRVHDCLWLRMWIRPQISPIPDPSLIEDVICSVAAN